MVQRCIMQVVMRPKRKPPLMLAMVGILLVLLPLLAYLQYDWQGRVSDGLREQMQSQMRRAATQFSEDFDREINRIYNIFQPRPIDSSENDRERQLAHDYADILAEWNRTAPYAGLVSNIYLVPRLDASPLSIKRLEPVPQTFESIECPADLQGLQRTSISVLRHGRSVQQVVQLAGKSIDRKIPAVIISILDSQVVGEASDDPLGFSVPVPVSQVIIRLNLDYIQKEFLPTLVRQHL